jgi:hypothetical protein
LAIENLKKHLISERFIFNIAFWLYIASKKKGWLAVSAEDGRLLGGDRMGWVALGVLCQVGVFKWAKEIHRAAMHGGSTSPLKLDIRRPALIHRSSIPPA